MTNSGGFNPSNSPGTFAIDGDLALLETSVLTIEIAGLAKGIEYDELIVTGNILFAGQLNVVVDNSGGHIGSLLDSFDPITYSTGSGTLSLTATPGYAYASTVYLNKLNILTTLIPRTR